MGWFLGQSVVVLVAAFLLGLLVGWLWWGRFRRVSTAGATEVVGGAQAAVRTATRRFEDVSRDRNALLADHDAARADRDAALAQRDAACAERDQARAERDALRAELAAASADRDAALAAMGAQLSERDNVLSVREAEVQRLRALTAAGDIEIQRLRGLTATPPSRNGSEAPGAPGDSAVEAAADGEPAADGGAATDGDPEAGTQRTADAEHQDGTDGTNGTNGTDGPQGPEGTGSPEDGHEAGDGSDPAPGPAQGQRPSVRAAMRNGARVALRGGRRGGEDDFERIEGIGPRIATALREAGIRSYRQLADSEVSRLQSALEASGLRFAPSLPTWSQQAALLARGDEEGFAALTATLVAARQRAGRS